MTTDAPTGPTHRSPPATDAKTREVFLTPRVLDQAAYEELATALREMLAAAATEAASLRATLMESGRTRAEIAESSGKQKATLEISSKLLKAMTARAEAVEQMLTRIESGRDLLDRLSLESERMMASRLAALERAIADVGETVERRVAEAGARGRHAAGQLEGVVARAETLCALREGLDNAPTLETLVTRGETVLSVLADAGDRAEQASMQATKSTARLSETLGGSMKLLDGLEARGQTMVRTVETAMARAERSAADVGAMTGTVRTITEDLTAVTARACAERDGLTEDLSRIDRTAARLEAATEAARETMRDLEAWKPILEGETSLRAGLPPALKQVVEQFRREIGQDLLRMASAMQTVAERVEPSPKVRPSAPGERVRTAAG